MQMPSTPKEAYDLLHRLATALSSPQTRAEALRDLHTAADWAHAGGGARPLALQEVEIGVGARQERFRILLLPSIFAPESWAFTFLEGLLLVPREEWEGKRLVEVGTGSGWICVALAKLTNLASIEGVDLNPHAWAVATCNLWLNCDEEEAARVSFSRGDLLRDFPEAKRWDAIVGCIPQVLRAEGIGAGDLEELDEGALHDLSNYTAMQNVYEDHFGLGLIAKLLDEAPERLTPGGRLFLNLAGRPGRRIIERMFSRRGFQTKVTVARRVEQAADTEIGPLVTLEKKTRSDFEFYLAQHSAEPIRAETALGWLSQGHSIWHEVAVWEAALTHPHEILALRRGLREAGVGRLLGDLDLGEASQEQLSFVASLARRLAERPFIPYAHEAGDLPFRLQVSRYLARFFDLHLDAEQIFVGPEREPTVHSLLLATCDPGDRVLVTRNLLSTYERTFEQAGVSATVTNDTLGEVRKLLQVFDPKVVLLAVSPEERTNLSTLLEIVDDAAARGIQVIIDESAYLNITSGVESRTLFELLATERQRPNLVVLYGMIKNAVFPDFELTLLLPVGERLFADLEIAAEVTYSRISTLVQWFYEELFASLLSFQVSFEPRRAPAQPSAPPTPLPRSQRIRRIAKAEAFAPAVFRADDRALIRLDYGENEDRVPLALLEGTLGASLAPRDAPAGLREGIAAFLGETRGIPFTREEIVTSQGVWPLIHDTAKALGQGLGRAPRVFIAAPCYGLLPPTLLAAGCEVEAGPLEALGQSGPPPDAVVISQPANPQGVYLDPAQLRRLADHSLEHGTWILSDEIFGLLALGHPTATTVPSPVALAPEVAARTVIFGGLSKEFAAGGLRVGWAACKDRSMAQRIARQGSAPLQQTTARAAAHIYGAWISGDEGPLHQERRAALGGYLESVRRSLALKREQIEAVFGVEGDADPGGLFIAPKVTSLLGKEIAGERITPENLPTILYRHTSVVVNGGPWCSDRERIRVVYSIPREQVEEAASRLRGFLDLLSGPARL